MSDLDLALTLADAADEIALKYFRSTTLTIDTKPDRTPVTQADKEAEQVIRDLLAKYVPEDGILGEEFGEIPGTSGRRWILDPIDGTSNYARGHTEFSTLIALEDSDGISVGVSSASGLGTRWWAERGHGTFRDGEQAHVSKISKLDDAYVVVMGAHRWHANHDRSEQVLNLLEAAFHEARAGDAVAYGRLASGEIDVFAEPAGAVWDHAAISLIVEEAGGKFTDFSGNSGYTHGYGIATNGLLHDQVLTTLNDHRD